MRLSCSSQRTASVFMGSCIHILVPADQEEQKDKQEKDEYGTPRLSFLLADRFVWPPQVYTHKSGRAAVTHSAAALAVFVVCVGGSMYGFGLKCCI